MVLELLGVPEGVGPLFTAKNEEGSANFSKLIKNRGYPQRKVILESCFGPQLWQIPTVFTMRSRAPKGVQI